MKAGLRSCSNIHPKHVSGKQDIRDTACSPVTAGALAEFDWCRRSSCSRFRGGELRKRTFKICGAKLLKCHLYIPYQTLNVTFLSCVFSTLEPIEDQQKKQPTFSKAPNTEGALRGKEGPGRTWRDLQTCVDLPIPLPVEDPP